MARRATGKLKMPDDILELADAVHSTAIHLLRQLRLEDRDSGIGPAQLSALSVLVFGGNQSLKRLAEIEQVRPPTMVRIVQGLVEQRLATSRIDKDDKRRIEISATQRGVTLMHEARRRRVEALAGMLQRKSVPERREVAAAVRTLRSLTVGGSAPGVPRK